VPSGITGDSAIAAVACASAITGRSARVGRPLCDVGRRIAARIENPERCEGGEARGRPDDHSHEKRLLHAARLQCCGLFPLDRGRVASTILAERVTLSSRCTAAADVDESFDT
jgi:hypothetical protein